MPVIPGAATEIRYARTGPLAGRYYHRFAPGVRMHANRDGSVTLRGPRTLHAVESEPGFWERYGRHRRNPRHVAARPVRRRAPRRRRTRGPGSAPFNWMPALVFGLFWLWQTSQQTAGAGPRLDAAGNVIGAGVTPGDLSASDIVRGLQAAAAAQAAVADAGGGAYTGLSDFLRSGTLDAPPHVAATDFGLF